ncbi:MAG: hypothetical protein HC884_19030, partial [Chloroflexaceae bacterium]|nr:hypothetical protein [Chloroflexaceae bacterium]
GSVDKRTNLYYVQSDDFGQSWRTVDGAPVATPLTDPKGPGLVRDFKAEGLLVYVKDIVLDAEGRPAILTVTSRHHTARTPGRPAHLGPSPAGTARPGPTPPTHHLHAQLRHGPALARRERHPLAPPRTHRSRPPALAQAAKSPSGKAPTRERPGQNPAESQAIAPKTTATSAAPSTPTRTSTPSGPTATPTPSRPPTSTSPARPPALRARADHSASGSAWASTPCCGNQCHPLPTRR